MNPASIPVTVIVPMRDEERHIARCLASILENDVDSGQMEILVVDGCSTDRSREIAMEVAATCDSIKVLDNPPRIVSAALNIGIRNARGSVIIIMGAHAEYSRDYISSCLHELEATGADVVGGILETRPGGKSNVAEAIAMMSQHRLGVGGSAFRTSHESRYVDTVPYGAYRREVFERAGLFNEQLVRNQDFEFNARVCKAGGKLFLSANVRAAYYNAADLQSLLRQAFGNGRWLPAMWLSSPTALRLRHAVPALFVTILGLALTLGLFHKSFLLLGLTIFSVYALAVMVAATLICRERGSRLFIPLLSAFFTHHFAYGIGTLAGLTACARLSFTASLVPGYSTSTRT